LTETYVEGDALALVEVTTATLGVDRAWDRVLLGLALARSTGDGSYIGADPRHGGGGLWRYKGRP
jgi:hypothetical protein